MKLPILYAYRTVLRHVRPNSGLTPLSFNRVVNWLFRNFREPAFAPIIGGLSIQVDPHDYHGRILWLFGSNDFKVSRTVNALLDPAM